MMLVLTLACVTLAIGAAGWPGLAILFAVLVAPAIVRTASVVRRRSEKRKRMSPEAMAALLANSIAITIGTCLSSIVIFAVTCAPVAIVASFVGGVIGGDGGAVLGLALGIATGSAAAVAAASILLRSLWPDFDEPRVHTVSTRPGVHTSNETGDWLL
jgi:hypothetical protein